MRSKDTLFTVKPSSSCCVIIHFLRSTSILRIMHTTLIRSILYFYLAFPKLVTSSPRLRGRDVRGRLPLVADSFTPGTYIAPRQIATPVGSASPLPSLSSSQPLIPIENAAIWQEALNFDAKNGPNTNTNQKFYQYLQLLQLSENSSHPCEAIPQVCTGSPVENAAQMSEALQFLQSYPTRFDQTQAADPKTSIGIYLVPF